MTKILFVCLGNICRSPFAEFYFRALAERRGFGAEFKTASAGTSDEEHGNPVHPGSQALLHALGIDCSEKRARQLVKRDYADYDYLVGMDEANVRNMRRFFGGDPEQKIVKLLSFCGEDRDVADPWYTGDFEATRRDVTRGCEALLEALCREKS